jgi:CBS domain-containing protein
MPQVKQLTAADIMTEHVVTRGPEDDLTRIAGEMQRHNIGSVVIAENKKIIGILTERDFVRIVEQVGMLLDKSLARDQMTQPVLTVQSDTPVADIIKLMKEKHVRHLVVLNRNQDVAGIISSRDLIRVTTDVLSA